MLLPHSHAYTDYRPHDGQAQFHASHRRFKVLVAGARFGKSVAAAKDVLPEVLRGATRGWVVGPTYALARPEYEALVRDLVQVLGMPPVARVDGGGRGPSRVVMPWGGEVWCLSAAHPESLLGRAVDWLIMAEAAHLRPDVFERYLRPRLSTSGGRLVIPTTPRGLNWVHEAFQHGARGQPDWESFRFATWDNPLVSPEEIASARQVLPPETFDEQYGGAFTTVHGLVYREFTRQRHVADTAPAPGAIVYKAIDGGYTSPTCCLWAAQDNDNRLLVLREHYLAGATAEAHACAIHAIDAELESMGLQRGPAWIDPSSKPLRTELAKLGVSAGIARNDVLAGIQCVRMLMAPLQQPPRLVIDPRCVNLVRELEGYRWQDTSRPGERVPFKHDDHAVDALRYLCMELYHSVVWQNVAQV